MPFYDFLADCQTKTGALVFTFTVKPLEWLKNLRVIGFRNTDSVVLYGKQPRILRIRLGEDVHARNRSGAILYGVADQILQNQDELGTVSSDTRQTALRHQRSTLLKHASEI